MSSTAGTAPAYLTHADRLRRLKRLATLSRAMDTAVRIPIVGIRFGLDSVVGLVPGVGDIAGGLVGLYMVNEARQMGVPAHKLAKMLANVGIDAAVGSVPVLGDVFDVFFKAHWRNLDILLDHFDELRPDLAKDVTPGR
ncbi:DUF4112 domain-containing protein [Consotaella aegiceratis]|uniref:DUF4112 domain-containing protein n=1 Tax=Consotaella aegiceratis TaxID=3097961 RepID=UPI002F4294FA